MAIPSGNARMFKKRGRVFFLEWRGHVLYGVAVLGMCKQVGFSYMVGARERWVHKLPVILTQRSIPLSSPLPHAAVIATRRFDVRKYVDVGPVPEAREIA